jgi:nucleoside-diphosphate-sugar epimerase
VADIAPCDHSPALWQRCDIRDVESVRRVCQGRDFILNLAAQHRDDVTPISLYHEVNVEGSRNVCRVAEEEGIDRILFTSSAAIYGFPEGEVGEESPARPFNEYGRTKWAAEGVYREWLARDPDRRSLTIVRPTVVFGEGNRGNVFNLLNQVASRRFVMVGDGRNRKSMAYVENVAGFLEHCVGLGPGEHLYNYVDKPDLDMNALVGLVRGHLGGMRAGGADKPANPGLLRIPSPVLRTPSPVLRTPSPHPMGRGQGEGASLIESASPGSVRKHGRDEQAGRRSAPARAADVGGERQFAATPVTRVPYALGWLGGLGFDVLAWALRRKFSVSRIRVKKFCSETVFAADRIPGTGYRAPFTLQEGLERTVRFEFGGEPEPVVGHQ